MSAPCNELDLEWYKIRDLVLGSNYVERDLNRALELASVCEHKSARWLSDIFAGVKRMPRLAIEEAVFFLERGVTDPLAVCFAEVLAGEYDLTRIETAGEMGCAFAQARMAAWSLGEKRFKFAQNAVLLDEREGWFWLGCCFEYGDGCDVDLEMAKSNFLRSAGYGDVEGMVKYGALLKNSDPHRWLWWGRAAELGMSHVFLSNFAEQVQQLLTGTSNFSSVYAVGRALEKHIDIGKGELFGDRSKFHSRIGPAHFAVSFYLAQNLAARKAVDRWTLIGIRLRMMKDIRNMVGKLIWDMRNLALYTYDDSLKKSTGVLIGQ